MTRVPDDRSSFGGGAQVLTFGIVPTVPRDLYICVCIWTMLGVSPDGKRRVLRNQHSQRNITVQSNSNI